MSDFDFFKETGSLELSIIENWGYFIGMDNLDVFKSLLVSRLGIYQKDPQLFKKIFGVKFSKENLERNLKFLEFNGLDIKNEDLINLKKYFNTKNEDRTGGLKYLLLDFKYENL